ncbi:MAG: hypothetical protein KGZ62_10855 [Sulfurimonas sp.]|nr:hypothetical protein [Sulfurimonas sp.]
MSKLNVDDITRGAMAVLISLVKPKSEAEGLTVTQAALALNISVSDLNFMRYHNIGPEFYRDGSKVFYKASSIRAYIPQPNTTNTKKRRAA